MIRSSGKFFPLKKRALARRAPSPSATDRTRARRCSDSTFATSHASIVMRARSRDGTSPQPVRVKLCTSNQSLPAAADCSAVRQQPQRFSIQSTQQGYSSNIPTKSQHQLRTMLIFLGSGFQHKTRTLGSTWAQKVFPRGPGTCPGKFLPWVPKRAQESFSLGPGTCPEKFLPWIPEPAQESFSPGPEPAQESR